MEIEILRAKLHRACVTEANLNYVGSVTIDEDLLDASGLLPNEKVQVVNINTGARIETYIITGKRGSGVICLNGAAARHFMKDDFAIIMGYGRMSLEEAKTFKPCVVLLKADNTIKEIGTYNGSGGFEKV